MTANNATTLTEAFRYLDNLRESGVTNMFGAAPYLESEFYMTSRDARDVLSKWMKTFDGTDDIDARVAEALKVTYMTPSGTAVKVGDRTGEIMSSSPEDALVKFAEGIEEVPYSEMTLA